MKDPSLIKENQIKFDKWILLLLSKYDIFFHFIMKNLINPVILINNKLL